MENFVRWIIERVKENLLCGLARVNEIEAELEEAYIGEGKVEKYLIEMAEILGKPFCLESDGPAGSVTIVCYPGEIRVPEEVGKEMGIRMMLENFRSSREGKGGLTTIYIS